MEPTRSRSRRSRAAAERPVPPRVQPILRSVSTPYAAATRTRSTAAEDGRGEVGLKAQGSGLRAQDLNATRPPTIVYVTWAVRISSSGTVVMSFDSTVMSASFPGASDPFDDSSNAAYAAFSVYDFSASIRLIR